MAKSRRKLFKETPPRKSLLTIASEHRFFNELRAVIDNVGCVSVELSRLDYWGGWLCEWHCREEKRHALQRRDFKLLQEIKPAILTLRGIPAPRLPLDDPIRNVCAVTQWSYTKVDLYQPHYPEFVTASRLYVSQVAPVVGMLDVIAHDLQITDARRGLESVDSPAECAEGFRKALSASLHWIPYARTACNDFYNSLDYGNTTNDNPD